MGQKVNPIGLRLNIVKTWNSIWYADRDYATFLIEDQKIRKYLKKRLYHAGVSKIELARTGEKVRVKIHTARPGIVIGKKGARILRKVIESALANASQNEAIDVDTLYIKTIFIDGGPMLKRIMPRAQGRASRILKRSSHITVVLDEQ